MKALHVKLRCLASYYPVRCSHRKSPGCFSTLSLYTCTVCKYYPSGLHVLIPLQVSLGLQSPEQDSQTLPLCVHSQQPQASIILTPLSQETGNKILAGYHALASLLTPGYKYKSLSALYYRYLLFRRLKSYPKINTRLYHQFSSVLSLVRPLRDKIFSTSSIALSLACSASSTTLVSSFGLPFFLFSDIHFFHSTIISLTSLVAT